MLETTERQRAALDCMHGTMALVQFLLIRDQAAFEAYRSASERVVIEVGGKRTHDAHIDQVLAGGDLHYQVVTVDLFPSSKTLQTAFDALSAERGAALSEIYALVVRPTARLPQIVKGLGFLAPLFSQWLGTTSEREMTGFAELANQETGPIPETIAVLREHDQTTPFYMMNLNKYYPRAQYHNAEDISGEQAYNRYSARILPYLVSVGGYPSIIGHNLGIFVGDESSALHDDWSKFAMVYYPSRQNFIKMMINSPKKGVYHRDAGLQRAVLMPSSDFSECQ
ncbi:MAG: hypothetical protein WA997_13710 [Anaerolineales bacterium]